jgi:hypothetical protein
MEALAATCLAPVFAGELSKIDRRPPRFRRPRDWSGGGPMMRRCIRSFLMQRVAEQDSDQNERAEDCYPHFVSTLPDCDQSPSIPLNASDENWLHDARRGRRMVCGAIGSGPLGDAMAMRLHIWLRARCMSRCSARGAGQDRCAPASAISTSPRIRAVPARYVRRGAWPRWGRGSGQRR